MFGPSNLKGKNIAITGASRGIGKASAELLANAGANVLLGARSPIHLNFEGETSIIKAHLDVTDEDSVMNFLNKGIESLGNIDVLINCAGYGTFTSVLDLSTEDFDRMIDVNLRGSFLTSKYFAKHMVENKKGHIININSIAGNTVLSGCSGYSASKYGLLGLSKVMQLELRNHNVYVTSVLPGSIDTPFWDNLDFQPDRSKMIPLDTIAKHIAYILCQPEGSVIDEVMITPPLGVL